MSAAGDLPEDAWPVVAQIAMTIREVRAQALLLRRDAVVVYAAIEPGRDHASEHPHVELGTRLRIQARPAVTPRVVLRVARMHQARNVTWMPAGGQQTACQVLQTGG